MSRSRDSRRLGIFAVLLLSTAVSVLVGSSTPALATQEVSFRIVTFGEGDCVSGSDVLIYSFADPFDVDVCVVDGGDPVAGLQLTAVVSNSDETTTEILGTTDADGKVTFEVIPVGAGTTSVVICLEGDCDHGSVKLKADGPARPPAIPSYLGTTTDVGASSPIEDGIDDFDDPNTGGAAGAGSGDPAMDIASFRYLGIKGGVARFEITTRGDARALLDEILPFVQWSIEVTTPDGGSYNISYRLENGKVSSYAFSGDAELDGVVVSVAPGDSASTVIVSATGVDVPEGSTMRAGTWLSRDEASSGYQDFVDGVAAPAAIVEENETPAAIVDEPDETEIPLPGAITEEDEGGSLPIWIPLATLGVLTAGYAVSKTRKKPDSLGPELPGIIDEPRPGKGVGGGPDSPPLIGVPGWKI